MVEEMRIIKWLAKAMYRRVACSKLPNMLAVLSASCFLRVLIGVVRVMMLQGARGGGAVGVYILMDVD